MKTAMTNKESDSTPVNLPLKKLVNALIAVKLDEGTRKSSFFINEIKESVTLNADRQVVSNVLDHLFRNVLCETDKTCIRISAKTYSNVLLIHICGNQEEKPRATGLVCDEIRKEASRIGGYVGLTRMEKNRMVIAFSFPNLPAAA